ncbi:MAG: triose-phosphate isomerase [Burkholderiaceae bacterium]|nr:triose-phosphate isomerase [Burkholderiaceae bacterium]
MHKKLVIGNWKMNGSLAANDALLHRLCTRVQADTCEVSVCVPAIYIPQAAQLLRESAVSWGAQDCSAHQQGAFTGEISAAMLSDFGCKHVIVGHSERRQYHNENNQIVVQKMLRVLETGLSAIVCVGETLAQRQANQTLEVISAQLQSLIDALKTIDEKQWLWRVIVAYEPIWAIGTGQTATAEQAQQVHAEIRKQWEDAFGMDGERLRILYGGSVKASNAVELFAQADIDGGLIGGASLKAEEFLAIVDAAS